VDEKDASQAAEDATVADGGEDVRASPVFILGPFHSATSILYRMLAMHPETTWFSQFSVRDGTIPGRRRLPFYAQIDRFSRPMFRFSWRPDNKWRELLGARPSEAQLVWEHVIPRSGSKEIGESVKRLRHVLETEARHRRNKHCLVKYPNLSLHLPVLTAAYPQAKFLHIVRDGRAVALSLRAWLLKDARSEFVIRDGRKVSREGPPPDQPAVRSEDDALTRAAHYWLECIRMIQAEKAHMDLFEVRYEDFCEDVHGHLAVLLEHAGLTVDTFPFDRCPKTLTATNERWIESASPVELGFLETLLGDQLRLYSYL
jgi:hypothetical protein